jgi:hypothetical protein
MIDTTQHLVIQLHRLKNVHDIKHDVRRAQDIAAKIEDDIGARFHRRREAGEAPILLRHHLCADEEADGLSHALEVGIARRLWQALLMPQRVLGKIEHLARIDPFWTGRDTGAARRTYLCPASGLIMALTAAQDVQKAADDMWRVGALQIAIRQHGADVNTFAAGRAILQNRVGFRFDVGL